MESFHSFSSNLKLSSANSFNSEESKIVVCKRVKSSLRWKLCLTHYQTTNFKLFQTERVCRRQFQNWRKWQKVIQTGRKHWEKEKLLVTSNFSFSHSVFKRLVPKGRQKVLLCGNGLRIYQKTNLKLPNWKSLKMTTFLKKLYLLSHI